MSRNRYERLKVDSIEESLPVEAQATWTVSAEGNEVVQIMTALLPEGLWVYGLCVYWDNGRKSIHEASALTGRFRSQRDAQLYAIGFMLDYARAFTEETRAALYRAEAQLQQMELFN